MIRKQLLWIWLCLLATSSALGQSTITGRITDASSGEALPGVSVTVKGKKSGTMSNTEGTFSLSVEDKKAILVFSYVGYIAKEIAVGNGKELLISLESDAQVLNEVVVVGYQSVNRRDLTGSVSSVGAKQLKDIPLTNAAEALTGRLAGVRVTTSEGAPGADVQIRIRGGGSITQDNSPIYIVDGIQIENALNFLSPQDIESIDVLKDASTTAIYGARGANGVVIITTKSGKGGKTTVSYNGSAGYREISRKLGVLNPYEFVRWQYERSRGSIADSTSFANQYGTWQTINQYQATPEVNWQDAVFGEKATYQNHNFIINGGSQNTNFNLSITANQEEGILKLSGFDRKLVSYKLDHKASQAFRMGFNVRYLNQTIDGAGTSSTGTRTTNRLRHSVQYRPFLSDASAPIDTFDEDLFVASSQLINPLAMIEAEYRQQRTNNFHVSGYLQYQITKALSFRSTLGIDRNNQLTDLFFSKITPRARNASSLPVAQINQFTSQILNLTNILQYGKKWKDQHDLNIILGQEVYQNDINSSSVETRYFPADISAEKALANMGLGAAPTGAQQPRPSTNIAPSNRLFSLFGRVNYAFKDRYLASFSLRSDRSSKFNYENGALIFPSGTFAWRFTQEGFTQNWKWLTDGKLRIGYGTAGNNRIGDLLYQQLYDVTGEYALNKTLQPGFAPIALANPDLRWESNVSQNIGLDLAFSNNRFQLTLDAYRNVGKNLLLAVAIPPTTGYASQIRNLGSTENRGIEVQFNAIVIQKKDFQWSSNFNWSANRNKVLDLGTVSEQTRNSGWQGSDGADDFLVRVGSPIGLMYGFVTDGFYTVDDFNFNPTTRTYTIKEGVAVNSVYGVPQPGMLKWKDLDGDGLITADKDRTVIGNANPKFIGGWSNQVSYKNWDASIFVNWVVGNDIYNANKIEMTDGSFPNLNMLDLMKNRWTNINSQGQVVVDPAELSALNANAEIWSPVRVQRYWLHSWAVEDGSFLRINNLTLGYSLPTALLSKAKISRLRLFGTVNNLATFTRYSGYDPEVNTRRSDPLTQGVDFAGYPRAKTYVAGVNLTF